MILQIRFGKTCDWPWLASGGQKLKPCAPRATERMIYQELTEGILIRVSPAFSLADSSRGEGRFVFTYHVEMENQGEEPARLLFRHWKIHDAGGEDTEVNGEGVMGQQPLLIPGGAHEHKSYCILESPAGFMEGEYTFERPDGSRFKAKVPRFSLAAYLPGPEEEEVN